MINYISILFRYIRNAVKLKLERDDQGCLLTEKRAAVYLPRSVFYTRFPAFFGANIGLAYNTYHRSSAKRLDGVRLNQFTFQGNQSAKKSGMYPKTGNFYNPFKFATYHEAINPQVKDVSTVTKALWYDRLLNFQKQSAKYLIKNVEASDRMQLNADHDYPCVLVALAQPAPAEKNIKIWTNFISIFFIAICNKLAAEKGLNIEMVRRSSFDAVRPSVAECGKSLRISLGLTPKAYHLCVAEALGYLDKLFENSDVFDVAVDPNNKVKAMLTKYNKIKSSTIKLESDLWKSLWANGDSLNRSFATQIFRHEHVVEYIIDQIIKQFGARKLKDIFDSIELKRSCFANPLVDFFASLHCDNKKLSTYWVDEKLSKFQWPSTQTLTDKTFWTLIHDFGLALGADKKEIDTLCTNKNLGELYQYLEYWLANFTFNPRKYDDVEDGCGSDSDTEDTVSIKNKPKSIFSRKFITATGMRAIQLSFAAAKKFLEDNYDTEPTAIEVNADKMYYETDEAVRAHAIPYPVGLTSSDKGPQKVLNFFDINHCNALQLKEKRNLVEVRKRDKICILDATSATTAEMAKNIIRIWKKAPNLRVIVTISSGLKNEQGMSDYNPYGTVRIFSRLKEDCQTIYNQILALEKAANYEHPQASHLLRKNAKDEGFTPTNSAIIAECKRLV